MTRTNVAAREGSEKEEVNASAVSSQIKVERQLQLLKARLLPLTKHSVFRRILDISDSELSKWLAYCDNNALLANAKIRMCQEYRRKHNIDDMLTSYEVPEIGKYYPGGICGNDREGSPVYYELFGVLNLKDIMESSTRQDLIKFKIYQHEKIIKDMKALSRTLSRKVDTILVVVDMQHCTKSHLWNPALRMWAEIIEVLQDLYPGLVKEVLVINVHPIYPEVYLALRPYLSRSTLKLIKVIGQGYMKYMLQRIEKHQIPAFLGGYKCDYNNNPLCLADLNWSTQVPQFLHFNNRRMFADALDKTIPGGEQRVMEYHVPIAKSLLVWEVYEVSHPLTLTINLNSTEEKASVLTKTLISNSHHRRDSLLCHMPGRYNFVLDNSKSFAHSARINFKIEVIIPHETMSKLASKVPLGKQIDFQLPVGEWENKLRQELDSKYPHMKLRARDESSHI